jgi:cytochrome c553
VSTSPGSEEAVNISDPGWEILIPTLPQGRVGEFEYPSAQKALANNFVRCVSFRDNPWFTSEVAREAEELTACAANAFQCRRTLDRAIDARKLRDTQEQNYITAVHYDPTKPVIAYFDSGSSGQTSVWFVRHIAGQVRFSARPLTLGILPWGSVPPDSFRQRGKLVFGPGGYRWRLLEACSHCHGLGVRGHNRRDTSILEILKGQELLWRIARYERRCRSNTGVADRPHGRTSLAASAGRHFPRTRTENVTMTTRASCTRAAPAVLIPALLLAACAQTPMGPTVQVLPGPNKSFADFQNDQAICRQFAQQAVGDQARGANLRGLGVAALTTALGAGLGGAIGGGSGAGIGAAAGAIGGAGIAGAQTSRAQNSIQAQYDAAFVQCMFSLGNSVPSMGPMMTQPQAPGPR